MKDNKEAIENKISILIILCKEGFDNERIICITTKFSGSIQSALNARAMIREEYPNAEITVIDATDATVTTVLQGQYVLEAAQLRDHGVSYQNSVQRLEEIKSTGRCS
ncbi:MAG: DegV family protein [Clostridiales bacterium]|nr:DegV family protein [Clostridiales bacterium]